MTFRVGGPLLAAALGVGALSPAAAQQKPTVAVMPAQYFSATAESAQNLTQGLQQEFENKGYTVVPSDKANATFQSEGLSPNMHYADRVALKFGREAGADLVAYPRLLVTGIPAANPPAQGGMLEPAAVVLLRVINVHTGAAIYARQVGHDFRTDQPATANGDFTLPQPVAVATAQDVSQMYFERVAGSRQEFRRAPDTGTRTHRSRRTRRHSR